MFDCSGTANQRYRGLLAELPPRPHRKSHRSLSRKLPWRRAGRSALALHATTDARGKVKRAAWDADPELRAIASGVLAAAEETLAWLNFSVRSEVSWIRRRSSPGCDKEFQFGCTKDALSDSCGEMLTGLGLVYMILISVVWIAVKMSGYSIPSMVNLQFRRAQ